jgi:exodeoxyribonuclease VII small subunit
VSEPKPAKFEEELSRLEEILRRLERGDLTLDDSVAEYERGIAALRACRAALDGAERKIEELVRAQGGEVELRPFRHEAWKPDANRGEERR